MSSTHEARLGELDGVLMQQQITPQLGEELFALVDLLDSNPALRRALTDTGAEASAREALVTGLFGERVSASTRTILAAAVADRWPSGSALSSALERQGVRAVLATSQQAGTLDDVQDELFRFERLVESDRSLQAALGDRTAPLEVRRQLVDDLLAGKVDAASLYLAKRAVAARNRSFALTIEQYLTLAALLREQAVAHVVVARPLTDEQARRLSEVLGRQLHRDVTLQVEVDPGVIGGVRITVGDEIIEGTVAGRLESARRQLG